MKIYLATWLLEPSQGTSLTKVGKRERLLSYYHLPESLKEFINYIKEGVNKK